MAGMQCCLWALVQLWLHLLVVYGAFYARGQKVQAYVWALHASTNVLSCWRPKGRVLNYPGLQRLATVLGVGAVSGFAWQAGVPSGIAPWYQGRYGCQGQCGYRVHLVASLGVDLVRWALSGLGLWAGSSLERQFNQTYTHLNGRPCLGCSGTERKRARHRPPAPGTPG